MIRDGQFVLFSFPQTDQVTGKLRPALILRRLPGAHDDWLVCMVTSQLRHEIPGVDEVIRDADPDFPDTGLKTTSLIRVSRIAVVSSELLHGVMGNLSEERVTRIRTRLAHWILGTSEQAEEQERTETEQPAEPDT